MGEFVENFPWAHLDIAGTFLVEKDTPYIRKGATGVGVRLLTQLILDWKKLPDARKKRKNKSNKSAIIDYISIKGARQHNLKSININIPRDQLVVITGVSGSGNPPSPLTLSMRKGSGVI